ncbi:hypothetical protein [Herpetosiphon geysericola]|nr:hypothetical protein [Herpetosiphon geysericola]
MSYRVPTNNQHLKLQPGEEILWQGQPVQGFKFYPIDVVPIMFGSFWLYFGMTKVIFVENGEPLPTPMLLIILSLFFSFASYMMIGRLFFGRYLRRYTFYTLTNRRAMIHIRWLKRDYQHSYDLAQLDALKLDRQPNGQQSIIFTNKLALPQYLFFGVNSGFGTFFEGIPNAEALYQQILALQAHLKSKQIGS